MYGGKENLPAVPFAFEDCMITELIAVAQRCSSMRELTRIRTDVGGYDIGCLYIYYAIRNCQFQVLVDKVEHAHEHAENSNHYFTHKVMLALPCLTWL